MRVRHTRFWLLVSVIPVGVGLAAPAYDVSGLGTFEAGASTYTAYGKAINDDGHICGIASDAAGNELAFVRTPAGELINIGDLSGGIIRARAWGLTSGENPMIVGQGSAGDGQKAVFWQWENGPPSSATAPDPVVLRGVTSAAFGVNENGEITGVRNELAFRMFPGQPRTDLQPAAGRAGSRSLAINIDAEAAGFSSTSGSSHLATFWTSSGAAVSLGRLSGGSSSVGSVARDLNDLGEVVGRSSEPSGSSHAVFWDENFAIHDLGFLPGGSGFSEAWWISNDGTIVGLSEFSGGSSRATMWAPSPCGDYQMYDLNDLIPASSGWTLLNAFTVGENGWILGAGINPSGDPEGYLLQPAQAEAGSFVDSRWVFDVDFSDTGGGGNDLCTAQGTVNLVAGLVGNAAELDGASYLSTDSADLAASRTEFTLSAWINIDENQATPDAGIAAQSNLAYGMTHHNGKIWGYVDSGSNYLSYPIHPRGGWHHVAEVFDGTNMSILIDGVRVATKVSASASTGPGAEFRVGKSYDSSALLVGAVDELFFTDVALSLDDLRVEAGFQPVTPIAVGDLLIGDVVEDSILRVSRDTGETVEILVQRNSGGLGSPEGMTYGPDGNLYVASAGSDEILRYDGRTGDFLGTFVTAGAGGLVDPDDLVFGPDGHLYVTANVIDRVMKFDGATGAFVSDFVPSNSGGLDSPRGLAFGPDGNLYVSGLASGAVHRYDGATGAYIDDFVAAGEGGLGSPYDIVFGPDGHLYVADTGIPSAVRRYDGISGIYIDDFIAPGTAGLRDATGLAFSPDGDLYVTERFFSGPDPNERRVLRFDGSTGTFVETVARGGLLDVPFYLLFVPDLNKPTADAGADQSIHAGELVELDGSGSFDDESLPGDLTYMWTVASTPAGSTATLAGSTTVAPSFTPDLPGTYEIELVVSDEAGNPSEPDTVVVSSTNLAPTADAGADTGGVVGQLVGLDGTGSNDPEGDSMSFDWGFVSAPEGSTAVLTEQGTEMPSFVPDLPGSYLIQLVVGDGFDESAPDEVLVTVISGEEFAENETMHVVETVENLSTDAVTTAGNQAAFSNLGTQAIRQLQDGNVDKARTKLMQAISRTDGCALRGEPDGQGPGRDWITDCEAQLELYESLNTALDALSE